MGVASARTFCSHLHKGTPTHSHNCQVETAQQLKLDLAILAEAFSAKEAELEAAHGRLVVAEGREEDLKKQVALAEDSLKSLTAMLSELQTTNTELAERFEALEASFRATSEQRADAEARAMETSQQLVEARDQVAALRDQLSAKNKALADTAQALSEAQAAESSQRMAAQTLSERLAAEQAAVIKQTRDVETLREQVVVLNEQIAFLSGSESSVKKLQEALRRSDGELTELRNQLADVQRHAQAADNSVGERVKDMDRLQRDLEAASAALVESESALALARRAAEATDSELRVVKRQAEAAATEVASMRAQVAALAGELTAVRQDRDAASRAEFESLRQLQSELAAEAAATLELLNKAESLVLASSGGLWRVIVSGNKPKDFSEWMKHLSPSTSAQAQDTASVSAGSRMFVAVQKAGWHVALSGGRRMGNRRDGAVQWC
ncbi:hypothetical protein Vretifemale_5843 [Volvox reticuliferus]|uniref:Uncharacterized protein n=1 Tax=Volvox reticuliferus TaxID=1737510 RepID=A0A8J4FKR1_9CHLO|nr:hypothetical protein Vretifemale_5843 [Volvox reticuliferus]